VVSRRGEAVQHPSTEIDLDDRVGVVPESEVRACAAEPGVDNGGVRATGELAVRCDVVAVCVGMEDEQPVAVPRMSREPAVDQVVDDAAQREEFGRLGRAGVDEHRPGIAEHQEHERRLVVDRLVLPQDVRVLVVRMDLDLGVGVVLRRG